MKDESFNVHYKTGLSLLIRVTLVSFFFSDCVAAKSFFNPEFLKNGDQQNEVGDLSYFDMGLRQIPGIYRVDIWLNGKAIETSDVEFVAQKHEASDAIELAPCLTLQKMISLGLNENYIKQNPWLAKDPQRCDILSLIPEATAQYDTELQRLNLSIPQAALVRKNPNIVPPEQFDQGIPAFLLNYKILASQTSSRQTSAKQDSYHLNLRPGLNIGAWRLRHYSTWSRTTDKYRNDDSWDNIYTYAQRDIIPLRSSLVLGQSTSPGDIFDSVGFTGVQLATDDTMSPENITGYAPVIRGIAKSNAKIVIRQNGYQIYETYVSPGAFEIDDLYQTNSNGDLHVTVQESDGSQQIFTVPYASLPVMRREGSLKYSLTSGVYRTYDNSIAETPFTQASASYGLPFNATLYGGVQAASKYQALAAGIGKNMGKIGAVSVDATQAWSTKKDAEKTSGQSWRIRYSKNITQTGTNFAIAGYRYSTSGFYTLGDVLNTYRDDNRRYQLYRVRNRTEMNINQSIGERLGYISLGGVIEDFWDNNRQNRSINTSYSNSWNNISYSLNYSYVQSIQNRGSFEKKYNDQIISLTVSLPLDQWLHTNHSLYAFNNMNIAKPGETSLMVGVAGTALEENNLNWSVQQGYGNKSNASGNLDLSYQGTYGELASSYGYSQQSRRFSYGISGGMIVHERGLTLSQSLGESVALVEAPGAAGTSVSNHTGVKTDFRGYTVVPYVTPYRLNDIVLNSETLPDNMELNSNTATVVPTRGAVVRSSFDGKVGIKGFIRLLDRSGKILPFGATVTVQNAENNVSNFVGEEGQVYLTGLSDHGSLFAKWGNEANKQCKASYDFRDSPASPTGIQQAEAICQ